MRHMVQTQFNHKWNVDMAAAQQQLGERIPLIPEVLNLYRRENSNNYYFEILQKGQRLVRRSTGKCDLPAAATVAKEKYGELMGRQARGLPLKYEPIMRVIRDYLEYRHGEYEKDQLTYSTFYQDRTVLEKHFLPWVKEQGFKSLADIDEFHLLAPSNKSSYREWRLRYPTTLPDKASIRYIRDGQLVETPITRTMRRVPTEATLKRQMNPIKGLYQYAAQHRLIKRSQIPDFTIRKPEKLTLSDYDSYDPRASTDNKANWLKLHELEQLIEAAEKRLAQAMRLRIKSVMKYGSAYVERSHHKLVVIDRSNGRETRITQRAWYRLLHIYYIKIMVNTGMRPVGASRMRWKHVMEVIARSKKRKAIQISVYEKRKIRDIVCEYDMADVFRELAPIVCEGRSFEEVMSDPELLQRQVFPLRLVRKALGRLFEDAGLGGRGFSPYTFRHTYINYQMLYNKIPIERVATQSGNSVEVIKDHYDHISPLTLASHGLDRRPNGMWSSACMPLMDDDEEDQWE